MTKTYIESDSDRDYEDSGDEYRPSDDENGSDSFHDSPIFKQAKKRKNTNVPANDEIQNPIENDSSKSGLNYVVHFLNRVNNCEEKSVEPIFFRIIQLHFSSLIFTDQNEPGNEAIPSTSHAGIAQNFSEGTEQPKKNTLPLATVKKHLKDGKYSLREVVKRKLKTTSSVWKYIQNVLDENQNILSGIYHCSNCSNVIVNENTATTPFLRHITSCMSMKGQKTITQYAAEAPIGEEKQNTVKVSMHHRQNLKDGMCQFICNDLRPFASVEGQGFVTAMCASFELGQANPNLSRSDFHKILPGRTTVQKDIETKAELAKKSVKTKLQQAFQEFGGFACTSDIWSDDFRQKNYITVTAHVPVLGKEQISSAVHFSWL